jgi:hypothetical protein
MTIIHKCIVINNMIFIWIGSVRKQRAEGNIWSYRAEHKSGWEKTAK